MTIFNFILDTRVYFWGLIISLGMGACELKPDLKDQSEFIQNQLSELGTYTSTLIKVEKDCEPRCDGSWIIDAQCGRGDCSIYGTTCIADPAPRCGTPECPKEGEATVCVDDYFILSCSEGVLTGPPGDCSQFAAWCSTAGVSHREARCVSTFCFERDEVPYDHEVCSPNQGYKIACYADSTIDEIPCPSGEICSVQGGSVQCRVPVEGCGLPSSDSDIVDHHLCLPTGIGRCYNGNIVSETICAVGEECYDDGTVRCVESACLDQNEELINGLTCQNNSVLILCDQRGSVIDLVRCRETEHCVGLAGEARCQLQDSGQVENENILDPLDEQSMTEADRLSPETTYQDESDDDHFQIRYGCGQARISNFDFIVLLGFLFIRVSFFKRETYSSH